MEKVKPVPYFLEDKPTTMIFPGFDRGDVRVHKDGSVEWSRSRDARWLSLNLSKDLGQAIYGSVEILIGISSFWDRRIEESQDGSGEPATSPAPDTAGSAARFYHEDLVSDQVVRQGVEYPGGRCEVRLADDGAASFRCDHGSWQPLPIDDKVREPLHIVRRLSSNLIYVENRQQSAYKDLLQAASGS